MDFFAGSATTAHAVMAANAADGGDRRFILVQAAEPAKNGATIAQLARRRIISSAGSLNQRTRKRTGEKAFDPGFRSFRVDTTNMNDLNRAPEELSQERLELYVDSVKSDRAAEDLLFQVLLDWGLDLSLSIVRDGDFFCVADDALIACFSEQVSVDMVTEIAKRQPLRAIFRDSAFKADADRINAEQLFREISPATEVRTI